MSHIEVVGLGALNMDHIYRVERILEDGEAVVREAASFPGGSAANTIYGLTKLGVSAGFIGAVGDDAEGNTLLQNFREAGVDTSQIRVKPDVKTGSTLCLSDDSGRRSIYVLPGANSRLTLHDLDPDYINRVKLLHVSSFVDEAQFQFLPVLLEKLAPSVKVSFSPGALYASKGLRALGPILARTHVLFVNYQEMRQLTGDDVCNGAEICLNAGCRITVATLGKGANFQSTRATSYIMSAENEYISESLRDDAAPASDTTGAGDAFAAGFLYGLLKDKGLEECGQIGDTVAQFAIARIGARPGLPTLEELARRYRQLYGKAL